LPCIEAGEADVLVTVSAFREPYEAHLFRGRLQAEGIVAFVAHEMNVANAWHRSVALGGVKVQVSSDELELAREIEQACRDGVFKDLLRAELSDLDDTVCPYCGGTKYRKRRPLPRAALAVAISLYLTVVLPPVGWIRRCESCLKEYRAPHRPISAEKWILGAAATIMVTVFFVALQHWLDKVFGCSDLYPCL
jgi:hypothetical protein